MLCGQTTCTTPCQDAPTTLEGVLRRFEQEAVRGVCDLGRYRCHYWTWGQGPPLAFIHGLGDASRAYLPVAATLACGFRCIAYELPSGRDDAARLGHYTHDQRVEDLFALLGDVGVGEVDGCGTVMGSTIA